MASYAQARVEYRDPSSNVEASSSGVSWAAVIAGAVSTAALSLILLALGTGIGLSSISPWSNSGLRASSVGIGAIVWLIVVQIIASAMGGYLAGRLRTKWVSIHTHEVYFRDTAHGFLVWAVALVITVMLFASAAASIAGGAARNTSASSGDVELNGNGYFVDSLFRTDQPKADSNDASVRAEASLILARALREQDMPAQDKSYLTGLVAARTGLTQAGAEKRVSDTIAEARQAADDARKATAHSLYWLFVAFLIGAFCASFAATIGGWQRDSMPAPR